MTTWTDFVKSFAKDNNISYGCALSDPNCSAGYKAKYGVKKPLGKKKETERMSAEDINRVSAPPPQTPQRKQQHSALKQKINKKNTQKQLVETIGMMKEDINRIPIQDIAGNFVEVQPETKKSKGGRKKGSKNKSNTENISMVIEEVKPKGRGRPKKYATAEEARKAKIANTIASAKKRRMKKGGAVIDRVNRSFQIAQQRWARSNHLEADVIRENRIFDELWQDLFNSFDDDVDLTDEEIEAEDALRDYFDWVANLEPIQPQPVFIPPVPIPEPPPPPPQPQQPPQQGGSVSKKKKQGKGILKKSIVSAISNIVKNPKAVIFGRNDYSPKVRKIISKYGSKNIIGITLGRTPLGATLMTALQIASGNTFKQKLDNTPYDKLFHLFACIEFADGSKIKIEKNEVINAEKGCKLPKETETKKISSTSIPISLTLDQALNNTKTRMGKNYFDYSAKDNNCQDFITAFLKANNIGDETDVSWVKQETQVLFEGNERLRKIANTLTGIAGSVDVIRQGAGYLKGGKKVPKKRGGILPNPNPQQAEQAFIEDPMGIDNVNIVLPQEQVWTDEMEQDMIFLVLTPLNLIRNNLLNHRQNNTLTQAIIQQARNTTQNIYDDNEDLIENPHNPRIDDYLNLENFIDNFTIGGKIIDFEDMKWGSFSKQLKAYNTQHKKKLNLKKFAMMVLANPNKFQERTKKRARFYLNVILKKGGMIDEENDPLFQNPLPIAINLPPPPPPPPSPEPPEPVYPLRKRKVVVDVKKKRGDGLEKKGGMIKDTPAEEEIEKLREKLQDYRYEHRKIERLTGTIDTPRQIEIDNLMYDIHRRIDILKKTNPEKSVLEYLKKRERGGKGLAKKKSNSNTKMPNKWITYVKEYAKKNNMKYNDALKDPKLKAGYKSGGMISEEPMMDKPKVTTMPRPFKPILPPKETSGMGSVSGLPTERDEYIAQLYNQANLGANGRVDLN
jgi:hypothetical protein